jgi:hypothetical protein
MIRIQLSFLPLIALVLSGILVRFNEADPVGPQKVELQDQYNIAHILSFPAPRVTLLTIADRKGSKQVAGWIEAIKPCYGERIDIWGLADCGGAPAFLRGWIRKKFQETLKYPVMMDWSGEICSQFGFEPDLVNILVIGTDGVIRVRVSGEATTAAIARITAALDQAVAASAGNASVTPLHGISKTTP